MEKFSLEQTLAFLADFLPNLIGALVILVMGWVLAAVIARAVRGGVGRLRKSPKVASWLFGEEADAQIVETWAGRIVFIISIVFVLVGFFQILGLSQVTEPLTGFLNEVFVYVPSLIGPAILVLVAWIVAKALKLIVGRGLTAAKLDQRLSSQAEMAEGRALPITRTLSEAVYWLTFLLFLPAILSALKLRGLLEPVLSMTAEMLSFLPNLLAAAVILFVGWLVARILRRVVTNVLDSVGTDRLSERVGLKAVIADQSLSKLIGLVVYILILIPVIVAGLNALALEAVTRPTSEMLNELLAAVPNVFAALLVLFIAYIVGRVLAGLVENLLHGAGFDNLPVRLGLAVAPAEAERTTPSRIVGQLVLIAIILFALVEAFSLIGFEAISELGSVFLVFSGNIIVGLVIIGLGLFLADIVGNAITAAKLAHARLLALAARMAILILGVAMGLGEMGLAEEIIEIAFALLFGTLALAVAIAFGIGGRDVAQRIAEDWVKALAPGGGRKEKGEQE